MDEIRKKMEALIASLQAAVEAATAILAALPKDAPASTPAPAPTPTPAPTPEPEPEPQPEPQPSSSLAGILGMAIPDGELWGGSDAKLKANLDDLAAMGCKMIRFDIRIGSIRSSSGAFNWAITDKLVDGCRARGIEVLGLLNGATNAGDPAARFQFATFCEAAVRRYSSRVKFWEILNEPNHTSMTPEHYTALLKEVYRAIKAVDRSATVISCGNASIPSTRNGMTGAEDWLKRMYAAGARGSFDAVAHHPYEYPYLPEERVDWGGQRITERMLAIMKANGDGEKLIWLTECGAPTNGASSARVSEAKQAETLRQLVKIARTPGSCMGPVLWYGYRDRGGSTGDIENWFGCLAPDGRRKPVYDTFRQAAG